MQAISNALNRLLETGSFFVRAKEIRLLAVRVSGDLRKPVLQILAGLEFFPDNLSPWTVLEDAHLHGNDGWQSRANRILASWEERRTAFRKQEGIELPVANSTALASAAGLRKGTGIFREAMAAVLESTRAPMAGAVVVLAPTLVDDVERLGADLDTILHEPRLDSCRFVLVVDEATDWPSLLQRIDAATLIREECLPDPAQQTKDLHALLAAPPALFGRAGPRGVKPPRRIDAPPALEPHVLEEKLRAKGLEPEYLEKAPELRNLLLGAALAMKEGRTDDAIRMQRAACQLAESLRLINVTVICLIALASYLSGVTERSAALAELTRAVDLAERNQLSMEEAQGRLAMGLLHSLEHRVPEAIRAYTECARRSEQAGISLISIEAWRLAGQLQMQSSTDVSAVQYFQEAIRVAEGATPSVVQSSSASEAARKLANIYKTRGLPLQASSLFDQADAMDQGRIGVTPVQATEE